MPVTILWTITSSMAAPLTTLKAIKSTVRKRISSTLRALTQEDIRQQSERLARPSHIAEKLVVYRSLTPSPLPSGTSCCEPVTAALLSSKQKCGLLSQHAQWRNRHGTVGRCDIPIWLVQNVDRTQYDAAENV